MEFSLTLTNKRVHTIDKIQPLRSRYKGDSMSLEVRHMSGTRKCLSCRIEVMQVRRWGGTRHISFNNHAGATPVVRALLLTSNLVDKYSSHCDLHAPINIHSNSRRGLLVHTRSTGNH